MVYELKSNQMFNCWTLHTITQTVGKPSKESSNALSDRRFSTHNQVGAGNERN